MQKAIRAQRGKNCKFDASQLPNKPDRSVMNQRPPALLLHSGPQTSPKLGRLDESQSYFKIIAFAHFSWSLRKISTFGSNVGYQMVYKQLLWSKSKDKKSQRLEMEGTRSNEKHMFSYLSYSFCCSLHHVNRNSVPALGQCKYHSLVLGSQTRSIKVGL